MREAKLRVQELAGDSKVIVSQESEGAPVVFYLAEDETVRAEGATQEEALQKFADVLEQRSASREGK